MQMICLFFPALVSCAVQGLLEKKEWKFPCLLTNWASYGIAINMIIMMFYHYVLKNETGWAERFGNNAFVIHYLIIAIILALVFPFIKLAVNPMFSIRVERK